MISASGWCPPADPSLYAETIPPLYPCDGRHHQWERVGDRCGECYQPVGPRWLECALLACDARLDEGEPGFEEIWVAAE